MKTLVTTLNSSVALAHAKGPQPREERRTHHDLVEVARFHMKHGMTLVCAAATAATVAATVAATAAPGRERATVAAVKRGRRR